MNYKVYIFDLDGTLLDTLNDLAASVNYALRKHRMPEHSIDDVRRFVGNGVRLLMERAVPEGAANPLFEAAFASFRQHYMAHSLDTTRPYEGIPETLAELRRRGCRLAVVSNKMMPATQELCRHFFPDTIEVAIGENEAAGIHKKPAPDTVFEALRQLGYPPTEEPLSFNPPPTGEPLSFNSPPTGEPLSFNSPPIEEPLSFNPLPTGEPLSFNSPPTGGVRGGHSGRRFSGGHSAVYIGDSDVDIMTARNSGLPCISVLWGFRDQTFLQAHGATTFISKSEELLDFASGSAVALDEDLDGVAPCSRDHSH